MKVSEDEKKNQIALSLIEAVGDKIGKKLLAYFGSAKAIFLSSKSDLKKVDGIGKVLVNSIINANVLTKAWIGGFQRWQMNCCKQNLMA